MKGFSKFKKNDYVVLEDNYVEYRSKRNISDMPVCGIIRDVKWDDSHNIYMIGFRDDPRKFTLNMVRYNELCYRKANEDERQLLKLLTE